MSKDGGFVDYCLLDICLMKMGDVAFYFTPPPKVFPRLFLSMVERVLCIVVAV